MSTLGCHYILRVLERQWGGGGGGGGGLGVLMPVGGALVKDGELLTYKMMFKP